MSLALLADVPLPDIWGNLGATAIAFTPSVLIGGVTGLYLWAVWRVGRADPENPWSARRTAAFVGAMVLVFFAIELVLGVYDDTLFYDHMIQHLLLIMLAAPLIAMGAPTELLVRSTTGGTHRVVTRVLDSTAAEVVGHPITGFVLYTVFIPVAHLTSLYNFTLTNDLAHDNEHLAFLVVGYLFWRPVVAIEPSRHPLTPALRLVYLMLAVPVDTFCGLVLASTNHEMFSAYAHVQRTWGPSLIGDLHIGGSIMWVVGDSLMALAMIPVAVQWVRSEEALTRQIDAELDAQEAERQDGNGRSADPRHHP
jgi:putative copper resistance protein D